ncbi:hypothetical protein SAMN05216199_3237 [Pedococcus cremeus]|uniref:Uncharacterized protein n=1 Tax=Pedococcus cremeus TaxID=587636 RepID=A0A1H9WYP0_9MICO|nr:hypothetical protein [Pedococcus cremeus]SES39030.1 hypothetical protein SAMN05216199_3237 [Pedococcus cremeus]
MSLRRSISAHRSAAGVGGAVLLAALTVSGSAAAPALHADAAKTAVAAAPAALPSITKPRVTIASTASLVSAGSVFHLDIGYTCTAKSSTSINLEGHQNLNDGFVANGYGFSRVAPVCDGKTHAMRVTVVPMGERGFTTGPAFVIADVSSCTADGKTCLGGSLERTLTVR